MIDIIDKYYILSAAIKQLENDLKKDEKEVTKHSNKLANVNFEEVTPKGRANLRMNLDLACEKRDITKRNLFKAKAWKGTLKDEN